MVEQIPFSWLESNGWLVLSGSADALSEIRAQALSRVNADGAVAYISLAGDLGDALMDDMADLGAPSGYLVDIENDDNNSMYERLQAAGMIVIEPGDDIERLNRLMSQTVVRAIKDALNAGSLVLFEGIAASLAGEHVVRPNGKVAKGLKFVTNAYISPDTRSILETDDAEAVFVEHPETVFIAVQRGSALVLGPQGHVETWGEKQVTISLGSSIAEKRSTDSDDE